MEKKKKHTHTYARSYARTRTHTHTGTSVTQAAKGRAISCDYISRRRGFLDVQPCAIDDVTVATGCAGRQASFKFYLLPSPVLGATFVKVFYLKSIGSSKTFAQIVFTDSARHRLRSPSFKTYFLSTRWPQIAAFLNWILEQTNKKNRTEIRVHFVPVLFSLEV